MYKQKQNGGTTFKETVPFIDQLMLSFLTQIRYKQSKQLIMPSKHL